MPRANSICSVENCRRVATNAGRCPTHKRPPWAGSRRNINRPSNWRKIRDSVLRRDGFVCVKCGSHGPLEVDHIRPVARGGSWDMGNLQTLCKECHRLKTLNDSSGK